MPQSNTSLVARPSTEIASRKPKNVALAYFFWLACFLGFSGLHRIYMGRWVSGLIWMVTLGFFGVGNVIDLVMMPRMVDDANRGARVW